MKLVAYIRVSSDSQAEHGNGLEVQREAIRAWAKAHGHRVVHWCSDEGVSGTLDALDREGLACVIDAIETGEADGVVVARLDRLARRLHVQEAALAHLWRGGASVFAVDSGEAMRDDPEDPMRTAMRQMVGVFAELDRAMLTKRMRDGKRVKAAQGGFIGGQVAYGYETVDGELVPIAEEQDVLATMRTLRANGASLRAIAAALEAEGITAKRGGRWHPNTVRGALAQR
jgi:DNA invertase Pin-like site-specific DNA recombinase